MKWMGDADKKNLCKIFGHINVQNSSKNMRNPDDQKSRVHMPSHMRSNHNWLINIGIKGNLISE